MEIHKQSNNVEFDVCYDDGTKCHIEEGVLISVEDGMTTFHLGTSRLSVLFAAVEDLLKFIDFLGKTKVLDFCLQQPPVCKAYQKLLGITSEQKQATFRLGQMDMREAAAQMLLDLAGGTQGLVCATLVDAAERVRDLKLCDTVKEESCEAD